MIERHELWTYRIKMKSAFFLGTNNLGSLAGIRMNVPHQKSGCPTALFRTQKEAREKAKDFRKSALGMAFCTPIRVSVIIKEG